MSSPMNDGAPSDRDLFVEALKLSPENRPDFLDRVCGSDRELRRRVMSLLEAYEECGQFLADPTSAPLGDALSGDRNATTGYVDYPDFAEDADRDLIHIQTIEIYKAD